MDRAKNAGLLLRLHASTDVKLRPCRAFHPWSAVEMHPVEEPMANEPRKTMAAVKDSRSSTPSPRKDDPGM